VTAPLPHQFPVRQQSDRSGFPCLSLKIASMLPAVGRPCVRMDAGVPSTRTTPAASINAVACMGHQMGGNTRPFFVTSGVLRRSAKLHMAKPYTGRVRRQRQQCSLPRSSGLDYVSTSACSRPPRRVSAHHGCG
jgi:hypothetical protein